MYKIILMMENKIASCNRNRNLKKKCEEIISEQEKPQCYHIEEM